MTPPLDTAAAPERLALLRLASGPSPWAFVGPALAALRADPADVEVRRPLVRALAGLGLRTLAREHASALGERVPGDDGAADPGDVVPAAARIDACRERLALLEARGVDLSDRFDAWADAQRETEVFRAADGNLLRRRAGAFGPVGDWAGAATGVAVPVSKVNDDGVALGEGPALLVEGAEPWFLLERVRLATPATVHGYRPRITVIETDPIALLDALGASMPEAILLDDRIEWRVGPGAPAALGAALRERLDLALPKTLLRTPGGRSDATAAISGAVRGAIEAQQAEHRRAASAIDVRERSRGIAGRAERWRAALAGDAPPLRVLIPTSRFSTVVRHAARDLAGALEGLGCEARVLEEPDDSSKFVTVGHLRAFESFDPDLVVVINYTRSHLRAAAPPGVPFVCWIQDRMPHLFDRAAGEAMGETDFLAGHLHRELFSTFGYPRERSLWSGVVVSERRFHAGPVSPERRARFECELGAMTRHAETPRALRDRLIDESGADPSWARLIEAVYPRLEAAVAADPCPRLARAVRLETDRAMRDAGLPADPARAADARNRVAWPIADRLLRHATLESAARVCERRGWRLHIYGAGWERHPTLGRFARGEVAPGEDLRAAYACARATLHVSAHGVSHQRPVECALSGGLPLARRTRDAIDHLVTATKARLCGNARLDPEREGASLAVADSAEAMRLVARLQAIGDRDPAPAGRLPIHPNVLADPLAPWGGRAPSLDETWLLGDWSETTFASEPELERLLERAVTRPAWRDGLSAGIAARARADLTSGALARRLLDTVASALAPHAGARENVA